MRAKGLSWLWVLVLAVSPFALVSVHAGRLEPLEDFENRVVKESTTTNVAVLRQLEKEVQARQSEAVASQDQEWFVQALYALDGKIGILVKSDYDGLSFKINLVSWGGTLLASLGLGVGGWAFLDAQSAFASYETARTSAEATLFRDKALGAASAASVAAGIGLGVLVAAWTVPNLLKWVEDKNSTEAKASAYKVGPR